MAEAKLLAARTDDQAVIRIQGRATFKVAQPLRDYGMKVLDCGIRRLVLDLAECEAMDSTFMGVIAMIGLAARKRVQVVVANAGEHNRKLLDGIGVSKLVAFARQSTADARSVSLEAVPSETSEKGISGETLLEAHEVLMDLDETNIPKFRDVVELLRREMEQNETGDSRS
ncbi:MAG: STAS domain-containing protein [Kiritimatiellaeota bacterium]|nr:STAS domain-containing protein [Kiritimatiellota bacterium]